MQNSINPYRWFTTLSIIILIVSACNPSESSPPIGLSETPTAIVQTPSAQVESDQVKPIVETNIKPEYLTFNNPPSAGNMPFTILYNRDDWMPDEQMEALESTTVENCSLRPLLSLNVGQTVGPFELTVGENNFNYAIERSSNNSPYAKLSYYIYYVSTLADLEHDGPQWAFEMVTKRKDQQLCLDAIQSLLNTLSIQMPDIKRADHNLVWHDNLTKNYCGNPMEGRLYGLSYWDNRLIFNLGSAFHQLNVKIINAETTDDTHLLLETAFFGGFIQPPLMIEGDFLVFLDSENFQNTGEWNLTSYNLSTNKRTVLTTHGDHPTFPGFLLRFVLQGDHVYILFNEKIAGNLTRSSVNRINLENGESEEIFSYESNEVRLSNLSVNSDYLLLEQERLTKTISFSQPLILLELDSITIVENFTEIGFNPLLSEKRMVFALPSQNGLPQELKIIDLPQLSEQSLMLVGDVVRMKNLDEKYLLYQAWDRVESDRLGIFIVDLANQKITSVVHQQEHSALIEPIIADGILYFGLAADYTNPYETTRICSIPLEVLLAP